MHSCSDTRLTTNRGSRGYERRWRLQKIIWGGLASFSEIVIELACLSNDIIISRPLSGIAIGFIIYVMVHYSDLRYKYTQTPPEFPQARHGNCLLMRMGGGSANVPPAIHQLVEMLTSNNPGLLNGSLGVLKKPRPAENPTEGSSVSSYPLAEVQSIHLKLLLLPLLGLRSGYSKG